MKASADRADGNPRSARWSLAILGIALAAFLGIVLYGAVGLRGTDQYWYAGDVRMIAATGRGVTNAVYPGAMLGPHPYSPGELPPLVHNQPGTYAVALLGGVLDPYRAWLAANVALALATAALLFVLARRLLPPPFPAMAAGLFLVFPSTVWLTVNALSDLGIALGGVAFALGVQVMGDRRGERGLVLAGAAAAFLYWSRESFVLLLPALVVFAWLRWRSAAVPLVAGSALAGLFALRQAVLPGYPHAGFASAMMALVPGSAKGNMHPYYAHGPQPLDRPGIALRIARQLGVSLLPNGLGELATETLVLAFAGLAFWGLRRDRGSAPVRSVAIVYLAIYFLTAVAFQSYNRYLHVLVPLVILLTLRALALRAPGAPALRRLAPALAMGALLLAPSFLTAREYRAQALREVPMTARLTADLSRERVPGSVAIVGTYSQQVAYAVAPRPVIALDGAYMTSEEGARLATLWNARLVLIPRNGRDAGPGRAFAERIAGRLGLRLVRAPVPAVETQRAVLEAWVLEARVLVPRP